MSNPRITLEQWRALQAVVESSGYAQAAEALHKSQSTLTYAMQKIERKHLTLRTRLKRLARKTLGFSRSCVMHDLVIGLYMNQVEFGCAV